MSSETPDEIQIEQPQTASLAENLLAVPRLILVVFRGWADLLGRGLLAAQSFLRQLPATQLLFLISCLVLIVLAMPAWVSYSVNFSTTQTVRVGSAYRAMFVLPGFLGILLASINFPARFWLYLVAYAACVAAYIGGFLFPNPVHTAIIQAQDFGLTYWAYVYGVPLVGCGIFSRPGLAVPIFDWNRLFTKLSEESPASSQSK